MTLIVVETRPAGGLRRGEFQDGRRVWCEFLVVALERWGAAHGTGCGMICEWPWNMKLTICLRYIYVRGGWGKFMVFGGRIRTEGWDGSDAGE